MLPLCFFTYVLPCPPSPKSHFGKSKLKSKFDVQRAVRGIAELIRC